MKNKIIAIMAIFSLIAYGPAFGNIITIDMESGGGDRYQPDFNRR